MCLADFGLSSIHNTKNPLYLKCGTPGFLAPELLNAKKISDYNESVDLFSTGTIFYYL